MGSSGVKLQLTGRYWVGKDGRAEAFQWDLARTDVRRRVEDVRKSKVG